MDYISEAQKLARKWVYKIEWGIDPDQLTSTEEWDAVLNEQCKNPFHWSDSECNEFLYTLIFQDWQKDEWTKGLVIGNRIIFPYDKLPHHA